MLACTKKDSAISYDKKQGKHIPLKSATCGSSLAVEEMISGPEPRKHCALKQHTAEHTHTFEVILGRHGTSGRRNDIWT